jgi:hypothetical protein
MDTLRPAGCSIIIISNFVNSSKVKSLFIINPGVREIGEKLRIFIPIFHCKPVSGGLEFGLERRVDYYLSECFYS